MAPALNDAVQRVSGTNRAGPPGLTMTVQGVAAGQLAQLDSALDQVLRRTQSRGGGLRVLEVAHEGDGDRSGRGVCRMLS